MLYLISFYFITLDFHIEFYVILSYFIYREFKGSSGSEIRNKIIRQDYNTEQTISTSYLTSNSISAPTSPTTIQRQRNVRVSTDREERARSVGASLSADTVKNMRSILDEISETGSNSKYDSEYDYDSETGIERDIINRRGRASTSQTGSERERGREREREGAWDSEREDERDTYVSSYTRTDGLRENEGDRDRERERERENHEEEEYSRISTLPLSSSSSSSLMYSSRTPVMPPHPPPRHQNNTPPSKGQIGLSQGGYLGQRNSMWRSVSSDQNSTEKEIEKNSNRSRNNDNRGDNKNYNNEYIDNINNIEDNNDNIGLLRVAANEVMNLRESLKIEKKYNESLQSQLSFSTNINDSNMNSDSILYNQFTNKNENSKITDGTFLDIPDDVPDVRDDSNFSTNIGQKTYSTFMKETAEEILLPDGDGKR